MEPNAALDAVSLSENENQRIFETRIFSQYVWTVAVISIKI